MTNSWDVKLARAREHISEFQRESAAYLASGALGLETTRDVQTGHMAVRLRMRQSPPPRLGAVAGDAIQNLRAALDAQAYELGIRLKLPNRELGHVEFPITKSKGVWAQKLEQSRLLQATPAWGRESLRRLQPWFIDEIGAEAGYPPPPDCPSGSLWRLHDCARKDRHRHVHPILAFAGHRWLEVPNGDIETEVVRCATGQLGPATEVIAWKVSPAWAVELVVPGAEPVLAFDPDPLGIRPNSADSELDQMYWAVVEAARSVEHLMRTL